MQEKPWLKLGSLPLPEDEKTPPPDPRIAELLAEGKPFFAKRLEARLKPPPDQLVIAITALQRARDKAAEAAGWVQDMYFRNWLLRNVERATTPAEWTKARVLYEDYCKNARFYGKDWHEEAAVEQTLPTETRWGRMMATLPDVAKQRRGEGMYYALTLQREKKKGKATRK
ncbi:MAG: hypothetical protein ABL916_19105 [Burkholderiaceae bacterium]